MKAIEIRVMGSDGSAHGHGGWELDPEIWYVTDEEFDIIETYFDKGQDNLANMNIERLTECCRIELGPVGSYSRECDDSSEDEDDCKGWSGVFVTDMYPEVDDEEEDEEGDEDEGED